MTTNPRRRKFSPEAVTTSASVWGGPEVEGITFSLLSRFLVCRERFRILVVEGLKAADRFNKSIEYGQMWHTCEESLAAGRKWQYDLHVYCASLARRYPMEQREVQKWYMVCQRQFPIYLTYWQQHPDVLTRENLLKEQVFNVPYKLPSGRTVRLRGKWDSVDLIGKKPAVYLQENKTKGEIDPESLRRQLTCDLQTMMYLVALKEPVPGSIHGRTSAPISGVRYNVVRRPLSGGKGTIQQGKGTQGSKCPKCKGIPKYDDSVCPKCGGSGRVNAKPPESDEEYYARLAKYIEDEPEHYFMRWQVEVLPDDVARFRRECLDPILEQLCEWWDWVKGNPDPFDYANDPSDRPGMRGIHWRYPFGVWNPLDEGGHTEVDEYLNNRSEVGLEHTNNLFPELT